MFDSHSSTTGDVGNEEGARDGGALDARLLREVQAPAALRRALARVAGRMVDTRGWERLGFARLADYAAERAGVSARELRDLARVDRALDARGLRALEAAYLCGRIGWTRLRLLCRVAEPADQGRWLALAEALTARELAREVRVVDARARTPLEIDANDPGRREGVVLRLSRRTRARWWSARGMACKVAGQRLSHGEFAELLTAEVLSGVPLDGRAPEEEGRARERTADRPEAPPDPTRPPASATARPPPPSAEVAALERDLHAADAFELDVRLRRGLALEARGLARMAALLAEAVAWGLPRTLGFAGLDAYAEERLGMSPSRARALLRIERAATECPPLREAFASGRVSWVQAHALLPLLLTPEAAPHRAAWLARACRVSVRRLRDDAERALARGSWAPPPLEPGGDGFQGDPEGEAEDLQTGAMARAPVEGARLFFTTSPEVAHLFRALLATVQRRLERIRGRPACRSEALEAMIDHALAAWRPERAAAREHPVFERDGWRCAAPGCTAYRDLQRHHVVFRSRGGSDAPDNLVTLCVWHHLRGVHGGVLRCTGVAPEGLRFEVGLRPGRSALARYGSGDVLA